MYFYFSKKEHKIRKTLRHLSQQRVELVLQPGNAWLVIGPKNDEQTDLALKTAYLRGWVELVVNSIPYGELTSDGKLPTNESEWFYKHAPVYKITEAGWAVINRTHMWTMVALFISLLAIAVGLIEKIKVN
jgi:hypothetical protein